MRTGLLFLFRLSCYAQYGAALSAQIIPGAARALTKPVPTEFFGENRTKLVCFKVADVFHSRFTSIVDSRYSRYSRSVSKSLDSRQIVAVAIVAKVATLQTEQFLRFGSASRKQKFQSQADC